jgi:hypothetical protein
MSDAMGDARPIAEAGESLAVQLGCIANAARSTSMQTATLPPLRVTPDLRAAAESVLEEGESLSSFVETSVRKQIEFRRVRKEFIARGLAARDEAKRTGVYFSVEEVMTSLENILEKAKREQLA